MARGYGVAAGEQPPRQLPADPMMVMMEELLRIRRKAEVPAEPDTEKYFQRLNAYHLKRFIGDDDPTVLENWSGDIEKLYKAVGCPEKLKVSFGVYYLEGEANNWWTTVTQRAELSNFDWEQLKELIRNRFRHVAKDCHTIPVTCYNIGGQGHRKRFCPQGNMSRDTIQGPGATDQSVAQPPRQAGNQPKPPPGRVFNMNPQGAQ
ncbi:hypothetical protein Droror1_Dr00014634 [Drosera rotundifolia]